MKVVDRSPSLQFAIDQGWQAADMMQVGIQQAPEEQGVADKTDGSGITVTDKKISDMVVSAVGELGQKAVSEEGDTTREDLKQHLAAYGVTHGWYLDPLDGTDDFIEALYGPVDGRKSVAAFCLGLVVDGEPQLGVNLMPLVPGPATLYAAEKGKGAFKQHGKAGDQRALKVDDNATEGVVLVSENDHPHIDWLTSQRGIRVVRLGGFAFKLCSVLDPELLRNFQSDLLPKDAPILGLISGSAAAHDYAAGVVIAREAGALVRTPMGDETIPLGPGKHGLIVANNQRTLDLLLQSMDHERQIRNLR